MKDLFDDNQENVKESQATAERIFHLRDELEQHNYNYYVLSSPTISDLEFDIKLRQLQELEAAYPEFSDPNSPPDALEVILIRLSGR